MLPETNRSGQVFHALPLALLLALGAVPSPPSFAKTLHVSKESSASDANPGSPAKPLATIGRAIQLASPGDRVVVRSGDYRNEDSGYGPGVVPVLKSGRKNEEIRIEAGDGQTVIVRRFFLQNARHIRISNFTLQGQRFEDLCEWTDMPTIVQRNPRTTADLDYSEPWSNRRELIQREFRCYFKIIRSLQYESGFDLENCKQVRIEDNRLKGYWAGIQCRGCVSIRILRNGISHCYNGIYAWEPSPGLAYSQILNNRITQCLDNGIDLRRESHHILIEGNELKYNGRSHIAVQDGTHDCDVMNNHASHAGYYSETMQFPGSSALSINDAGSNILVQGNYLAFQVDHTDIDGNGIALDLLRDGSSVTVVSNICYRNMGDGLVSTDSQGSSIIGNFFSENGFRSRAYRKGAGIKLARDTDLGHSISGNMFVYNRAAGILSERTIRLQSYIDSNLYFLDETPIFWDAYGADERRFFRLSNIQFYMQWELSGMANGPMNP